MTDEDIIRKRLGATRAQISDFCRRWGIKELSLFGSVLDETFRPESDVDVLVVFEDSKRDFGPWLRDLAEMREELQGMFRRNIDLVIKKNVTNPFIRHSILTTRKVIYAA